jgi:iron complex outermembrane receptor protein
LAGTIELSSAGPDELEPFGVRAASGTAGAREMSAGTMRRVGGGFLSLAGRRDVGRGFDTTPTDQRVAATVPAAYAGWSGSGRLVAPIGSEYEIQLRGLAFDDRRTLRFAGADSMMRGQDVSLRLLGQGDWKIEALAYGQWRNFRNVVISATTFRRSLDQYDTPSSGYGGKLEIRPPLGDRHVLRIGADLRHATGEMAEDAYNATTGAITARRKAGGRQTNAGLFVEDDLTFGALLLTGGARIDRWTIEGGRFETRNAAGAVVSQIAFADRSGNQTTLRGGAQLQLAPNAKARAAIYGGFRLPTLNELYRPFVVFPISTEANAELKPERLRGYEIGLDLEPTEGAKIGLTLFDNRLADAIANVTIGTNLRQRRNIPAIRARGIELGAELRHGPLMLSTSYAYSAAKVDAPGQPIDGRAPAQAPRHAASATLGWMHGSGADVSTTLRYVGTQSEDDLGVDMLPEAITLDAALRYPLSPQLAIGVRAENLFDARVITRKVGTSLDLGAPRSFWITLSYGGW